MAVSQIGNFQVYIGDQDDAIKWKGPLICVLEVLPNREPKRAIWVPILKLEWKEKDKGWGHNYIKYAIPQQMNLVADLIQTHVDLDESVLIHCGAGQERSPLAVAWWFSKRMHIPIEEAYKEIKKYRPQTMEHLEWLTKS